MWLFTCCDVSVVGYTSDIGTKETNQSNEKNDIESTRETQLKNNNPKYDADD
ncbi:hypothetical protein YYC_02104 [Plasmodium yoelii 17X]|uniref:PYST-C1-like N-terminal domain-containing protein n=1 Tax=Plasmodium yoelii 17X TaxID=1323249 RepID=V7PSS5_PLAYE|nr:hypothetical protein YYC_02104 [Plasmodium yoelii 17X]